MEKKKKIIKFIKYLTITLSISIIVSSVILMSSYHPVSIKNKFDQSTYTSGNQIKSTITIKNNTNNSIRYLNIENSVPEGMKIIKIDGSEDISENNLSQNWTANMLKPKEKININVVLEVKDFKSVEKLNSLKIFILGIKNIINSIWYYISNYYTVFLLSVVVLILFKRILNIDTTEYREKLISIFNRVSGQNHDNEDKDCESSYGNENKKYIYLVIGSIISIGCVFGIIYYKNNIDEKVYEKEIKIYCDDEIKLSRIKITYLDEEQGKLQDDQTNSKIDGVVQILDENNKSWKDDKDNDNLPDAFEMILGTNRNLDDTDKDGLTDEFEIKANLNPNNKNSIDKNKLDKDIDLDGDGLTNYEEQKLGCDPLLKDTDGDGISDGDEINKYKTNHLKVDTDEDGVDDYTEINILKTDPLNKYTDGSNKIDGEKSYTITRYPIKYHKNSTVSISTKANVMAKDINKVKIYNSSAKIGVLIKDIPGCIASPYTIELPQNIDTNEIYLKFIISKFNNEDIINPKIYGYNKKDDCIELIENQYEIQSQDNTTSLNYEIEAKFDKKYDTYIVIDKADLDKSLENIMAEPINTTKEKSTSKNLVLAIDDSLSMKNNDPEDKRIDASKQLIMNRDENDLFGIVKFDASAYNMSSKNLTDDQDELLSSIVRKVENPDGTDYYEAIEKSIDILKKGRKDKLRYIVLLTDGEEEEAGNRYEGLSAASTVELAAKANIKIFTIGLGNANEGELRSIAAETGGLYFHINNMDELYSILGDINNLALKQTTDSDNDGIPDYYEEGMRLSNGVYIKLDPNNPDSDNDGLKDGDDICGIGKGTVDNFIKAYDADKNGFSYYARPDLKDTDGDKILDSEDEEPKVINLTTRYLYQASRLSYESIGTDTKGLCVGDVTNYFTDKKGEYTEDNATKYDCLNNFEILKYVDGKNGFGGLVLRLEDTIIISFTGSGDFIYDFEDWAGDFKTQFMPHPQRETALNFVKNIWDLNEVKEIYVTGHSLGGLLAQYVTDYLVNEKGYDNVYCETFNSANTMNPKHFKGEYAQPLVKPGLKYLYARAIALNSVSLREGTDLAIFLETAIANKGFIHTEHKSWNNTAFDNVYHNRVTNYVVEGDFLYRVVGGKYLGTIANEIKGSKDITVMNINKTFDDHALINYKIEDGLLKKKVKK